MVTKKKKKKTRTGSCDDYFEFRHATCEVIERQEDSYPLLFDSSGNPLGYAPKKIGFK